MKPRREAPVRRLADEPRCRVRHRLFRQALACCALALAGIAVPAADAEPPAPIRRSEYLAVDGADLYIETRGADRSAPVLLWLHGGPGGAERPLFRYFNGALEKDFVVAYWDQRGAGRSYDPAADPRDLTVARHLADLAAVAAHLRRTSNGRKLVLAGHSWGAALGLLYAREHPEDVSAIVAVNPMIAPRAEQQAQYAFVAAEAARRRDEDALARLRAIGAPPHRTADDVLAMEALANRYGAVFHTRPPRMWVLVRGVLGGLVTPWEIPRFIRANEASLEAMGAELLELDLRRSVPAVDAPVVFFLGRHDRHVEATLAAAYLEALRAPVRRLVWFEDSAHNVPFEEPARFNAEVVRVLESVGIRGGSPPAHDQMKPLNR